MTLHTVGESFSVILSVSIPVLSSLFWFNHLMINHVRAFGFLSQVEQLIPLAFIYLFSSLYGIYYPFPYNLEALSRLFMGSTYYK